MRALLLGLLALWMLADQSAKASSISICTVLSVTVTNSGDNGSSCSNPGPQLSDGYSVQGSSSAGVNDGLHGSVSALSQAFLFNPFPSISEFMSTSVDSIAYLYTPGDPRAGTITVTFGGGSFQHSSSSATFSDGTNTFVVGCYDKDCFNTTETFIFELGTAFSIEIASGASGWGDSTGVPAELNPGAVFQAEFTLSDADGTPVASIFTPEPANGFGCAMFLLLAIAVRKVRAGKTNVQPW